MDTVIDSLLGFVVTGLKDMIMYNYHLIHDAEDNAKALFNELEALKTFIIWCRKNHSNNDYFLQGLVDKVGKVVYQAEDQIERYIASKSRQDGRNFFRQALHAGGYALVLLSVSESLQTIRNEVQRIYGREMRFAIDMMQVEAIRNGHPQKRKALVVNEDNVKMVGFVDELEEVIELLKGESDELEVISITGLPGLGKTTLAKQVINHTKIGHRFPIRAFVHVSHEYKIREVFIKILGALGELPAAVNDVPDEQLVHQIQERLKIQKYLIVMDDVPNPEAWRHLNCAFPNRRGSMILITTQSDAVASVANPRREPKHLRPLREEESKELLRRKVFGDKDCREQFEEYELQIVKKCEGLALKIVLIAGILQNDRESIDWWEKVAEGRYTSVASDVIGMCYKYMPSHLKPCFLYLGVFHEDHEIPAWTLLQLWVAEGFVQQDENSEMSLEDSAENYLRDLVQRNLVMVGQKRANGQIKTYRIHGTVRDFCKERAKKENLFQEIKRPNHAECFTADASTDNHRRIFINSQVKDYIWNNFSGKLVRSFLSFDREEFALDAELAKSLPGAFELLRVLDIRSVIFPNFPDELLQLVLLRYIAISCNSDTLPQISKLWSLQTLIIDTNSPVLKIKADIWEMPKLRHLYTKAATHWPIRSANRENALCSNLQTLSRISPECCRNDVLRWTPNVKKLGIRGNLEPGLFDSLFRLESVEDLELLGETFQANNFKIQAPPEGNNSLGRLKRLTLRNILLDSEQLSMLGKVKNLLVLKLKQNRFRDEKWHTEDCSFPHLRVLQIERANLVEWKASENSFPQLSRLVLRHCRELKAIPLGFGRINSLQNIDLYDVCDSVDSDAVNIRRLKIRMQELAKTHQTSGFEPHVPQRLCSASTTSRQSQSDELLGPTNESQADEISAEPEESRGQELREPETQVSQHEESKQVISNSHTPPFTVTHTKSMLKTGKELPETQFSQDLSGENGMQAISVSKNTSGFRVKPLLKRLSGIFRKKDKRKNMNVV